MQNLRKTKIVCTLGPSTEKGDTLRQLMLNGMNVARFNFSHGDHDEQMGRLVEVRRLREELKLPIATLLDTKGPEIRLREFKEGRVTLEKGQEFSLTTEEIDGDETRVAISYKELIQDVSIGSHILIDDGLIELEVKNLTKTDIVCTVINGGVVSNKKGVNVPNVDLTMPFISEKDRSDIEFAADEDYDFIAASFVRCADDVMQIRKILEEKGNDSIKIISKIENMQGVRNIDEIINVSDGIMVARGDMGVEIPLEDVPVIQKMIIKKAYRQGKPVITATQMLDSMIKNPRPTRAEATDVANAIYDGTSAIMLSGETAAGDYPVEAVKTMVKIATRTEQDINYRQRLKQREVETNPDITNAISHATVTTADDLNAAAIITVSKSGRTARNIEKFRPGRPIIGCSMDPKVVRQLNLSWGVTPLLVEKKDDADELFEHAVEVTENAGLIKQGDVVVITAGVPLGVSGTTNLIKVHVAGHILANGEGIGEEAASGNLCVAGSVSDLEKNFKAGNIVVAEKITSDMIKLIRKASGLIVEATDDANAIAVGESLNIPVLLGTKNATVILKSGAYVTIDPKTGVVSCNQHEA